MAEKEKLSASTLRSRELGLELREIVKSAGMGVRGLARRLDWPHSQVSYILSGTRAASEIDIVSILVACNVDFEKREDLIHSYLRPEPQGWLQHYHPELRYNPQTLIRQERNAEKITNFQLNALPALLQTEPYARHVTSRSARMIRHDIECRVRVNHVRQSVFDQSSPPRATFFFFESALRASVPDVSIMSDQLNYLLLAGNGPLVEIRIIPDAKRIIFDRLGSFTLLHSKSATLIVHVEGEGFDAFLEKASQVKSYLYSITVMKDHALGREDSRELISAVATEITTGMS